MAECVTLCLRSHAVSFPRLDKKSEIASSGFLGMLAPSPSHCAVRKHKLEHRRGHGVAIGEESYATPSQQPASSARHKQWSQQVIHL